tara:strand:+ start:1119 stop:2978 length:1860 start_codon:yes stop_codon:yes gene_type:complete
MATKYTVELEVDSKKSTKGIDTLAAAIDQLSKSVEDFGADGEKAVKGVGESSKTAKKGVSKLDLGFKGLGLSMKAAGIGLIVSAFLFLKEALMSNQEVVDVMNVTFQTLNILTKQFTDIVVDNVKVLYKAAQNFESLGKVIKGVVDIGLFPMRHALLNLERGFLATQLAWEKSFFGDGDEAKIKQLQEDISGVSLEINELEDGLVESAKSVVDNFGGALSEINEFGKVYTGSFINQFNKLSDISISSAIDQANNLVQLKKNADLARVANRGLIEDYDRQAEQQRKIRDNDLNSISDRIAANNKLKENLEEQRLLMLENVASIEAEAQAQFNLTGKDEDRLKLLEAKNEVKAVEAQIEGFMSEQESNRVALLKEKMELDFVNDELTAARQSEQRAFLLEMEEGDIRRLQNTLDNLEIENTAEVKRLTEKRNLFKLGTQAYINANNELLTYQQTNANQQTKIEKDLQKSKQDALKGALSNVASLVGTSSKFGKSIAIAQAIQDTYAGADKAFAQGGIFGAISGAAIIAAGLMNVKKIVATKTPAPPAGLRGGASPSVPTPSIPSPTTPNIPDFSILGTSGTNQLASALGEQAPVQAFVVSQDVTTAQSLQNNIIQGATLGG